MPSPASKQRPSRHLRDSSTKALWRRLEAQERTFARRIRQIASTNETLQHLELNFVVPTPSYRTLRIGSRPRFEKHDTDRRQRSATLVAAAIVLLHGKGLERIRRADIVTASKVIDSEGQGVSLSVLYQNAECAALIARANGQLEAKPVAIPANARRLGRRGLMRRITDLENTIQVATTALMRANEQILIRRIAIIRENVDPPHLLSHQHKPELREIKVP